jgi:hypothetical protein
VVGAVGRNVAELSKTFRVGYDVATMLLVGGYFGAADEVALLAAVAEETRGDLNALWRTFFTQDGGAVQRPPKSYQSEAAARGSQHAAIVSLHRCLTSGPEELRNKLSTEIDLYVWDAIGRFAKRVGPRLSKRSPSASAALAKSWPFSAFLPRAEISSQGLGAWAAVLAASLPRCLLVSRGGADGVLAHAGGALAGAGGALAGAGGALAGAGGALAHAGGAQPRGAAAPRKFAIPDDVSGKATQGDVAACARLSVNHGGGGGKPMAPRAELATVFKATSKASEAFAGLVSGRAAL